MAILTVTARKQVTLKKEVLQHLGIRPGDKIQVDLLPDGRVAIRAAQSEGALDAFVGQLSGRSCTLASIDEINAATILGWAGTK
jgi:AbrB family looped-hinge helix DNA binding protein